MQSLEDCVLKSHNRMTGMHSIFGISEFVNSSLLCAASESFPLSEVLHAFHLKLWPHFVGLIVSDEKNLLSKSVNCCCFSLLTKFWLLCPQISMCAVQIDVNYCPLGLYNQSFVNLCLARDLFTLCVYLHSDVHKQWILTPGVGPSRWYYLMTISYTGSVYSLNQSKSSNTDNFKLT